MNLVCTVRFFSFSKCSLFHNSDVFGSCIIHILCTGCAKIKQKSGAKRLKGCEMRGTCSSEERGDKMRGKICRQTAGCGSVGFLGDNGKLWRAGMVRREMRGEIWPSHICESSTVPSKRGVCTAFLPFI